MRRRKRRNLEGDGPSKGKTQMPWILMPWRPNNETRWWRRDCALDVESKDTLAEIVPPERNPLRWVQCLQVMPLLGRQHRRTHKRRRWAERSCILIFEASQHRWTKKKRKIFWTKWKKRVFNLEGHFDVDLSCLGHLLCKHCENYVEFNFSSYSDKTRWE